MITNIKYNVICQRMYCMSICLKDVKRNSIAQYVVYMFMSMYLSYVKGFRYLSSQFLVVQRMSLYLKGFLCSSK